jgi:uncharacterized OB-fold protein
METSPVAQNLFTDRPVLRLIAGRHTATGRFVFPLPAGEDYERVELPSQGVLWSHTVQRFPPKSPPYQGPTPFEPFAVGYVELANTLIVESRLTEVDFEELRVGMPMELTTLLLRNGKANGTVSTFAFRPIRGTT